MTRVEVAELLESFAFDVEHIRGVSRRYPDVFAEDKSEVVGRLRAKARDLRTVPVIPQAMPRLRPGTVRVAGRVIHVELRGRRRA